MHEDEKLIHGKAFLKWLGEQVIPYYTRRVVIDAGVNSAVQIYVEMFGTDRILNLKLPDGTLDGAVVTVLDKPEDGQETGAA